MRLALGEIDVEKEGPRIRDHLTLVYAVETQHPLVQKRFPMKSGYLVKIAEYPQIFFLKASLVIQYL